MALYVSDSGNDEHEGLSPETARATLDWVNKAPLEYGDAVLLERGGADGKPDLFQLGPGGESGYKQL